MRGAFVDQGQRDRDQAYRAAVTRQLRTMGIRDKPIAPGSPWQTGFAGKVDLINPAQVRGPHRRAGRAHLCMPDR